MKNQLITLNGIIFFYILQRISEMIFSHYNEIKLKVNHSAREVNPKESIRMKVFHLSWFTSLIIETNINKTIQSNTISFFIYLVLAACLIVRIHTMEKLKIFWTIKVLSMKDQTIVVDGLYRYFRHPNYLIVILELLFIPLLFKAYITLAVFSILNLFVIYQRIKLEESTLSSQTDYKKLFANQKRIIPYIIMLFIGINVHAEEIKLQFKDYAEAKKSDQFIKFESISTKLGFISTTFDGYAKDIKVNYDFEGGILSRMDISIPAKSFDTDISGRDEKMHNSILEVSKYPDIFAKLKDKVALKEGEQIVDIIFSLKEKKITKAVKIYISKLDGKFFVKGSTTLSLKEADIPDPSIIVAKVRDTFDLSFAILL